MIINYKFQCEKCHTPLKAVEVYTEDLDGSPTVNVIVESCEACQLNAVEEYQAEQLAASIDKVADERRGH